MDTNNIKNKLEEEKKILLEELATMALKDVNGDWDAMPEAKDSRESDENDMADREEDFEEKSSTTDTLSKRLEDIDTALLNLENNTYGVCTMCGMKIEEDRLDANPAAQTCKMCMNKIA